MVTRVLLVAALVAAAALARRYPRDAHVETLLSEMESLKEACTSRVRVVVDSPVHAHTDGSRGNHVPGAHDHHEGHEDRHEHHNSHEDHETHHQHESHETHHSHNEESEEHSESHEGNNDVNIYIHTQGQNPHKDVFHDNVWQVSESWPSYLQNLYINATCIMRGQLTGEIVFRQKLRGGPTEFKFKVANFGEMTHHQHALRVHSFGVIKDTCDDIGPVFSPDHELHGSKKRRVTHTEHHEEDHDLHHEGDGHQGEQNHGKHRVDGDLGEVECDDAGMLGGARWYEHVTLVGAHTMIGRSVAIHSHGDVAEEGGVSDVLGCCTVVHAPYTVHL